MFQPKSLSCFCVCFLAGFLVACQPTTTNLTSPTNPASASKPETVKQDITAPSKKPSPALPHSSDASSDNTTLEQESPSETKPQVSFELGEFKIELSSRFLDKVGDTAQINIIARNTEGGVISPDTLSLQFSSSRPQDVSVSEQGLITALSDFGYAEITVTETKTGQTAKILISVASSALGGSSSARSSSSAPAPRLSSISPASAYIGDQLTLSGSYLSAVSDVTVDGFPARIVNVSSSSVTILIPAEALTGTVKVRAGSRSLSAQFSLQNRTWFVDLEATGTADGSSWENAFTDLQDALAVAQSADAIWVAEGTYTPSDSGDRVVHFDLADGARLYGGFVGTESFAEDRDWENHETVLSGDLNGDDSYGSLPFTNPGDNSLNILRHGDAAIVDGIVIEGGYANDTDDLNSPRGAGIYSADNQLTLRNAVLRNNYSVDKAGAWYNGAGDSLVSNVTFSYVEASGSGGGAIWNESGNLSFTDVIFDYCEGNGGGGGGIYNVNALDTPQSSHLSFENVTFSNSQANGTGGAGIYSQGGAITITNGTFDNLQANGGGGAGIHSNKGNISISQASFTDSQSNGGGGGGIQISNGNLTLSDALFDNNSATGAGGSGVYSTGANTLILTNITATNNAHSLGVINASSGALTGSSWTFTDNTATAPGGGAYIGGTVILDDVHFMNNDTTSVGGGIYQSGGDLTLSNASFEDCDSTGGPGGGIYSSATNQLISDTVFNHNTTTSVGAGALLSGTNITLLRTTFSNNSADQPGGGALISATRFSLTDAVFDTNTSDQNGGGLYLSSTDAGLNNVIFANNTSSGPGGGAALGVSNPMTISNGVFAGNTSSSNNGGGINASGGDLALEHVSFSENSAVSGDALYMSSGNLFLRNSIVWDDDATPIDLNSNLLTSFYSVLRDLGSYTLESGSTANSATDPGFINPSDPDGDDNVYATSDDGLMISVGSSAQNLDGSGNVPVSRDIAGNRRSGNPDAGAYEQRTEN